jgi:hypothetical protein
MRALLLLLFTLLAGSATAQDSVSLTDCKDDQVDCREECTVEYGGSTRTYDKLGACLQKCKQKYDKCRENQFKVIKEQEKLKSTPATSPAAPPSGTEKPPEEGDPSRRTGVYRASDSAPEPEPEPKAPPEPDKAPESKEPKDSRPAAKAPGSKKPEPEPVMDTTELDQLFDEQQPPPPPKTKAKTSPDGSPNPK